MIKYSVAPQINPMVPEAAPKYYAKAQVANNLDIFAFAKHIADHGSVYSRADIAAASTHIVDCLREELLNGNAVELGDLGKFSLSINSEGTPTAEEFTENHITAVHVIWTPGPDFTDLRKEADFNPVPTRLAQAAILKAEKEGNKSVDLQAIKDEEKRKREEREKENGGSTSGSGSGNNSGSGSTGGGVTVE